MKTKHANPFSCHHFDTAWFKKTNALFIIGLLLLIFCSAPIIAQEQSENRILETKSFLSNLRIREQNSGATYSNAQHIETLLTKIQPSVYYYSGTVKTYGEKPVCLFTDVQSLNRIGGETIPKNNIEMAKISIKSVSDLSSSIDLTQLSGFKNLRYIQIISSVQATEQAITNMVRNNEGKYSIFFKIQTGDSEQ